MQYCLRNKSQCNNLQHKNTCQYKYIVKFLYVNIYKI